MYVKFPNTVKIVFDQRGLGDSFPKFMNAPWTDPESGKEYPPFVCDDEHSIITNAMPMLRSVKANSTVNQQLATNLRVALEQRSIQLPINSRGIYNGRFLTDPEDDGEGAASKKVTLPEQAIFIEADAMQVEMGNIISKITLAGTYTYDTARRLQHKDRYSSLAMAVTYIAELEEKRKRRMFHSSKKSFIGLATKF